MITELYSGSEDTSPPIIATTVREANVLQNIGAINELAHFNGFDKVITMGKNGEFWLMENFFVHFCDTENNARVTYFHICPVPADGNCLFQ